MNKDRTPAPGMNSIDFYREEIDRLRAAAAWDVKILNAEIYFLNNRILEWSDRYDDLSNETDRLRAERDTGMIDQELISSEMDECLMRQTLLQCYSAGNGFHVSREHYRYLAEQIVALRQHSKREIDRLRAEKLLADEHYWEARSEIDRLRAEVERLNKVIGAYQIHPKHRMSKEGE